MRRFTYLHLQRPKLVTAIFAGLGAMLAISGLLYVGDAAQLALMVAPFGATCVLLFAAPGAPVSQPVNVIAGHAISCAIGLVCAHALPDSHLVAGLVVGLSITAMMMTRIVNPPAGATAFVAYTSHAGWSFLVFPVIAGSIFADAFCNGLSPLYWRHISRTFAQVMFSGCTSL